MTTKQRIRKPQTHAQNRSHLAAMYIRVSTDEQATEGYGLDVQRQQTEAYAAAFGLQVVAVYQEEGVSGTKDLADRPQLAQALKDAQQRRYGVLILSSLDRLARKGSLGLRLYDEFEATGTTIAAVKERLDTSTPTGRLMRTIFLALAELERDTIVERTTNGRNARGKRDGEKGGRVPYGYQRNGEVEILASAADVVRHIFAQRRRRCSLQVIANELTTAGLPTPQGGSRWYPMTVKIILDNRPIYKGGQRGESAVCWPAIL